MSVEQQHIGSVFSLPRPFLFLALRSSSWNRMPEKGVEEKEIRDEQHENEDNALLLTLKIDYDFSFY